MRMDQPILTIFGIILMKMANETLHKYSRAFIYIYIKNNPNIFGIYNGNISDEVFCEAERMFVSKVKGFNDNYGEYWFTKNY
jgi:hypothetical protein